MSAMPVCFVLLLASIGSACARSARSSVDEHSDHVVEAASGAAATAAASAGLPPSAAWPRTLAWFGQHLGS